jgi:hypothetical protein
MVQVTFKGTFEESNNVSSARKKLIHRAFRIPEDVLEALQTQANSQGMSLSNLVNKIFRDYLIVELQPKKPELILMEKDFFRRIFNKIDNADIEDFGREIGYAVKNEYINLFFPDINSSTIVSFLEIWFKRFQSYHHRVDDQNNRHSYSLNHDINLNFSKALKVILKELGEPIIKSPLIFGEPASSSITFTFDVRQHENWYR